MGTGHFCRSLYVAIQFGLSLIQLELDSGVQSLRILEADLRVFPADYLHPSHCHTDCLPRSAGLSDVPAYGRILLRLAIPKLRTVIVTAAVYWGFPSKLCLAANSSG